MTDDQPVSNSAGDMHHANVVQSGRIDQVTVHSGDRRTVPWLVGLLVVLLTAVVVIVWQLRREPAPEPTGDPLAGSASFGTDKCNSSWVVPDRGDGPFPYKEPPPDGVLGTGGKVVVTLQGLTDAAVVLQEMRAEIKSRRPAMAGVQMFGSCASEMEPRYFTLDLGPSPKPVKLNQTVDKKDVEKFIITVDAVDDVSWQLVVKWTSGTRSGELTINDQGKSFRTTGTGATTKKFCAGDSENWSLSCR